MPRREILTSSQRTQLLAFPDDEGELIRRYTLTKADLAFVREIECLETDFANDLSIDELAVRAQMSRSHFALTFQCTQNKDHKDCQKPPFLYEQD